MISKGGMVRFYGLFHWLMSGRIIPNISRKEQRFPGIGPPLVFWSLMVSLGTVMAPLGVPFSLLMCYNQCILRIKI